jgi:hypothetical protein
MKLKVLNMSPVVALTAFLAVSAISAATATADVVLEWNAIMVTTVSGQNPFAQARFAAITQLAVFEAVNACTGDYESYLDPTVKAPGASPRAAAVVAAHGVLRHYFPGSAASLDAARAASLATIREGPAKDKGIAVGAAAAAAMIALRASDGSAPPETFMPATTDPGVWQPTPPAFGPGILLHWRNLTPFGIESSDQFRSEPPPVLTSQKYRKDYGEVMKVGAADSTERPQDRTDVARFYNIASASYVWNLAGRQVSAVEGLSLSENARAFALLNMAISDGLVSSMETKYSYVFWRPVTAIRAGDIDVNPRTDPDAAWTPLITTPSFPSYPSAHASASYAGRRIAEKIFGAGRLRITLSHPGIPEVILDYTAFDEITDDIDDARVYGGIHFRFDQEAGARQGRRVGAYVYRHNLQRAHGNEDHVRDGRK